MGEEAIEADHRDMNSAMMLDLVQPSRSPVERELQASDGDRQRGESEPVEAQPIFFISSMNTSRPSTVKMPNGRLTKNTQCQE